MLYNLALDLLQLIMNVSSTAQGCMELISLTQNWKIYVFLYIPDSATCLIYVMPSYIGAQEFHRGTWHWTHSA